MQKLLLGFLLVGTLATFSTLTSCKKETALSTEQKIVGKWSLDVAYFDYHFLGTSQKDTIANAEGNYIQFNADGTTSSSDGSAATAGTWELKENKLYVTETNDDEPAVAYDIQKVTSNELHLYNKEIDGEDYVAVTLHLKK